jgi:hypothetical protein
MQAELDTGSFLFGGLEGKKIACELKFKPLKSILPDGPG